jgi:hypothetical protein
VNRSLPITTPVSPLTRTRSIVRSNSSAPIRPSRIIARNSSRERTRPVGALIVSPGADSAASFATSACATMSFCAMSSRASAASTSRGAAGAVVATAERRPATATATIDS